MFRRNAPKQKKSIIVIYTTFFLLFSIPLVIWGTKTGSFDIRNRAFDDISVSDENPCVISLPNVNPYTLDVGKSITVQVDAELSDAAIASLSITDSTGVSIYQQAFDNSPISISTSFKFTPLKSGVVDMLGAIAKVGGGSVACKISSTYDVLGLRAMSGNEAPTFTSAPAASKPSQDIKTETTYEYTLTATDNDGDRINYSYSFTPKADWLKAVIIQDGAKGNLMIKFQGSTTKAASYLANVFIHDGYSKHLSSQSWVISVSPSENDIPIVRIISPSEAKTTVNKGEVIKTSWEATDLNLLTKYEVYVTQNPTDTTSWTIINNNISPKTTSYSIDTSNLKAGTYRIIVKATDNQDPALSGTGISNEFVVAGGATTDDNDDVVILAEPQVTNMTPISTDTISNKQVTMKATLIAGENATIDTKSLVFKFDDTDMTSLISINKVSEKEVTIIYQPEEDLTTGIHKVEVSFKDSNEKTATKDWTFTIAKEETVQEGYVSIFGLEISQRTLIIIGVGLLVVIIAIVAPIIIFSVWKEEQKKYDDEEESANIIPTIESSTPLPPIPVTTNIVQDLPAVPPMEEEKKVEDVWDNYSAPLPQEEESAPVVQEPQVIQPEVVESTPVIEEAPAAAPEVVQPEIVEPTPVVEEAPLTPTPEVVQPEIVEPAPEPVVPKESIHIESVEPESKPEVVTPTPSVPEQMPQATQEALPPEPDLDMDIPTNEDLSSIFEQIQQVNQEETPTTKE